MQNYSVLRAMACQLTKPISGYSRGRAGRGTVVGIGLEGVKCWSLHECSGLSKRERNHGVGAALLLERTSVDVGSAKRAQVNPHLIH